MRASEMAALEAATRAAAPRVRAVAADESDDESVRVVERSDADDPTLTLRLRFGARTVEVSMDPVGRLERGGFMVAEAEIRDGANGVGG
jgi:hypothetical protein